MRAAVPVPRSVYIRTAPSGHCGQRFVTACPFTSHSRPVRFARGSVAQRWSLQHTVSCRRRHKTARCAVTTVTADSRDYYSILGVSTDASAKDLKSAFRRKALKLHPDVNKAPDAKEQFMAAKEAFQVLSDTQTRAKYDRQRQGSRGFDWGNPFGSAASTASRPAGGRKKQNEEPFYGLSDFFNDLEREWTDRRKRRGKEPQSLWEELADLGEEFVEFLENELGIPSPEAEEAARNSSSASRNDAAKAAAEARQAAEEAKRETKRYSERMARERAAQQTAQAEAQAKAAKDDVEEMLAELKRKLGK